MSASNAVAPTTLKNLLRQKLKPHNTKIIAAGLLLDAAVGILTLYADNPPFDPIVYGAISAVVKAANLGLHYLSKTIQGDDTDAAQ
jgi:hypothetical protein